MKEDLKEKRVEEEGDKRLARMGLKEFMVD